MHTLTLSTTPASEVIEKTCRVLKDGGLVLFPTETTYGAGVDATNPAAVEKLLAYKSRREGKPLSIAVDSLAMAEHYLELNEQARTIAAQFLPGPVTVVCKDKGVVAPGVASEFGTLGLRIPDYPLLLELITQYGKPITATSANGSGKKRPYSIPDILSNLSDAQKKHIDLILDAGTLPPNPPSTVIDTTLETPITLRAGALQFSESDKQIITTTSENETMDVAGKIALQHWNQIGETGLIIALDGPLGVGKTVFTKGIARFLNISETITSPTYSYMEEYDFTRHQTTGMLYHADLWKVGSTEEVARLSLADACKPRSVLLIEWYSVAQDYITAVAEAKKIPVVHIQLSQDGTKRILHITDTSL